MTGWQSIQSAFVIWLDLMRGNYENYVVLPDDCPFTECRDWFWVTLGEDNVYPKHFLEKLQAMVAAIDSGEVDLVNFSFEDWDELPD